MLIVDIRDTTGRQVWIGPYDDFENVNRDALSVAEFSTLFDVGRLTIGGGAAPMFDVALIQTDADAGRCPTLRPGIAD